ncbi:hypothetical protein [Lentibacillus sediminis]|uniref:hypothetical protein n=1 Tax=Lentibacillus sediminis TaxID=1940529 RepID=UPI000C1C8202|nr:hypothetical protein [Lentibacillus sediminis]
MDQEERTRPFVITGFILLAFAFLFKWRFIYSEPVGDRLLGFIGIPTWSNGNMGLHYTAIVAILLLIIGLFLLAKRYSGKMIFIFFLVFTILPSDLFANVYQSSFAKGIYALEFYQDDSHCEYDTNDSGILVGKCTLSFRNHSNQSSTFHVSVHPKYDSKGFNALDIINLKGQLEIEPLENKTFEISFRQPLHSTIYQDVSGEIFIFNVRIISEDYTREL